jgi:hypothetical protein
MKNTLLTFYVTALVDRDFEKIVLQACLYNTELESVSDAHDWISDNITDVMDMTYATCLFDHVVMNYELCDTEPFELTLLKSIHGELQFDDSKDVLKEEISKLKSTVKQLKKSIKTKNDLSSKTIDELLLMISEYSTIVNDALELIDNKKTESEEIKKDYPSCWIDTAGKVYNVGFACHNEFAMEYLYENGNTYDDIHSKHSYAYEMLESLGWVRILGWKDPPCFSLPKHITVKQRVAIKDYCLDNCCDLPENMKN